MTAIPLEGLVPQVCFCSRWHSPHWFIWWWWEFCEISALAWVLLGTKGSSRLQGEMVACTMKNTWISPNLYGSESQYSSMHKTNCNTACMIAILWKWPHKSIVASHGSAHDKNWLAQDRTTFNSAKGHTIVVCYRIPVTCQNDTK